MAEKHMVLKFLIENQEKSWSMRQVALIRKINYKTAYQALQKLKQEGVVILEEYGNTTLCKFNPAFNETVFIAERFRLQELLKNRNFKVVYQDLAKINSQFILLLFGSYAKGTQTKHSDIDFLLISENPEEVEKKIKLFPLNIHLTSFPYADFINMLKSKEFTVVSEAVKKNIIFFGLEDYYRMINNAR